MVQEYRDNSIGERVLGRLMMFYSDINLNFTPHPLTGDFTFLTDDQAVKRCLVHIGNMAPYDIPFEPDLHGHIRELLFELPTDSTTAVIEQRVKWAITKLEPRADVKSVEVRLSSDETAYHITVTFDVISLVETQTIEFYMERVR